jgi:hypothetical protein
MMARYQVVFYIEDEKPDVDEDIKGEILGVMTDYATQPILDLTVSLIDGSVEKADVRREQRAAE